MKYQEVRWGILGTANIAQVYVHAIKKSKGGVVYAIASRSLERAQEYAKLNNIPKAYGSYEELLDNPDVDAIYIPLPTSMHEEYTIKSAQKGKHVLCEKPLTTSHAAAKRMAEVCQQAGVQLMDCVMWVHHKRAKKIKEYIPKLGKLSHVVSRFNTPLTDESNIRFKHELEPLGSLGDLGWYCVKAILFAYSGELPESVYGRGHFEKEGGVPVTFTGILTFKDGKTASFDCGFKQTWRQFFEISGEQGMIVNDGFVIPPANTTRVFAHVPYSEATEFKFIDTKAVEHIIKVDDDIQEVAMVNDFQDIMRSGKLDSFWSDETVKEQLIIDALVKSATEHREVKL